MQIYGEVKQDFSGKVCDFYYASVRYQIIYTAKQTYKKYLEQ